MPLVTRCVNQTLGELAVQRVEAAHKLLSRTKGLLGRAGLEPDQGLWLKPCSQVHTLFMAFTIDVVFLDKDCRVAAVVREMKPWRISGFYWRARSALELAAGAAQGIEPGHLLSFERGNVT